MTTPLLPAFVGAPDVNKVYNMDALSLLRAMPDNIVNCVVTSPPYFGLRDYGVTGQIGLEETPQAYVAKLVELFREARRVLRDDGTIWLNLGDSYSGGGNYRGVNSLETLSAKQRSNGGSQGLSQALGAKETGLADKNLLGIPWRVAFGLQDDGWILRSDIIWAKPNPMPESVTDRPTKAHEYVFLFAKSPRYWYDADAIREPAINEGKVVTLGEKSLSKGQATGMNRTASGNGTADSVTVGEFRNKRSVWTVNTEPNAFAHFATFPTKLIEPMILAGCPDKVCSKCGAPWVREVEKETFDRTQDRLYGGTLGHNPSGKVPNSNTRGMPNPNTKTLGFKPTCDCNADTVPGVVYDPFMGSGTTALVARRHGRNYIGSELNLEYVQIARERLRLPFEEKHVKQETRIDDLPLFAGIA